MCCCVETFFIFAIKMKTGKVATVIGAATACAVAAVVVQRYVKKSRRWGRVMAILKELEEKCATPMWKLRQVADAMTVEMHAGLASEGGSKLKMLITYVDNLPTGYCIFLDPIQSTLICFTPCC